MFRLKVVNQQGEEIISEEGKEEVNLVCLLKKKEIIFHRKHFMGTYIF